MITDYRIVKDAAGYSVCLVEFDADQMPVKKHAIDMSAETVSELNNLLVYCLSSFTKPVIDADEFDKDKQHSTAINTALDLMRNNHD